MIANLLILFLVIGLAVLFGWLTYRAVRAKRMWVKIVGGIGAGLLTLVLVAIAFLGGKGMMAVYFPNAQPPRDLTVAGTPEQIVRGQYLVELSCANCHSATDADGNLTGVHPLSGGWNFSQAAGFGFVGDMVAENLTPGGKLADYSDGELFRALRYSINQDGHLLGFMNSMPYRQLSDEDTEAVIAYLRTLPPAPTTAATGDQLTFLGTLLFALDVFPPQDPPQDSVTAPPRGTTATYGKYVYQFGECALCHGPDATGVTATIILPGAPNPRPLVNALTQEQFFQMMRSGQRPGGTVLKMPFRIAGKLTDDDLAALYAYLTAPAP
jgi:mono/diheme cytochrome c family protein